MNAPSNESYIVEPSVSQIHNMPDGQVQIHYMTRVEPIFDQTPLRTEHPSLWSGFFETSYDVNSFQAPNPLYHSQQQPACPSSEGFPALTPSRSLSTYLSNRSTGLVEGALEASSLDESGSSPDLLRLRGVSENLLTPSTSSISNENDRAPDVTFDEASVLKRGTDEHLVLLRGINGYAPSSPPTEEHIEDADEHNFASLGPQPGLMPTLPTYASNQSRPEARPWNVCALQHHDGIVPGSVEDEDLSDIYEHCFAHDNQILPSDVFDNAKTEHDGSLIIEFHQFSRGDLQDHRRGGQGQNTSLETPHMDRRASGIVGHSAVSPASSAQSPNSTLSKGGRPEGYTLPEEDRISAQKVRDQGSCFRCLYMKEKCTPGPPPCENCRGKAFRLWMTPCSDKRLEERCEHFLPASLVSQAGIPSIRVCLKQFVGMSLRQFLLPLSAGFGEPWVFRAVELVPGTHELEQTFGFHRLADVERDGAFGIPLTDPPVVPLWIDPLLMRINIDCWLDRMIGDPDAGWQRHWFPDHSQIWQLSILKGICQHYQHHQHHGHSGDKVQTTAIQTLGWALKSAVLNYLMGHAFLVPEDAVESLFQQLDNASFKGRSCEEIVCPRAANKFVKMMVLPLLRLTTGKTLSGLHELFRTTDARETIWDESFAIVFLCLMIVSSTQRSLFQRAVSCAQKNDLCFSRADAAVEAQAIDGELVVHLIGMFHDKFRTTSQSKSFNPLSRSHSAAQPSFSQFAAYVKTMTDTCYRQPVENELRNIGAQRLLARFMLPFFRKP